MRRWSHSVNLLLSNGSGPDKGKIKDRPFRPERERMKRRFILFVSNTTGFRVGSIVNGILHECHRSNIGLLWREFDHCDLKTLRDRPLGVVVWGKLASIEGLLEEINGRFPIVSTISHTLNLPVHTVVPDPVAIATQVAAHLVEEGLRNFIYVGAKKNPAAQLRAKAFEKELHRRLGVVKVTFFNADLEDRFWGADTDRGHAFIQLLRKSPMPVGVFAFNDQTAASCLECAELAGIRVPQQMSVVGVDDHPIFSRMYLPLSTVKVDYAEIGQMAVRLLLKAKSERRGAISAQRHFVGGQLIVRESSRPRLVGDAQISRGLHYLHEYFAKPISLVELAAQAGMSRASFAARFHRAVGVPPMRYLSNLRLDQAKLLLAESPLTISEIAFRVGFEDQGYFTRAFKKNLRTTPSEFRHAKSLKRLIER